MDITRKYVQACIKESHARGRPGGGGRDAARSRGVAPGGLAVARSRIERPMIQIAFRVHPG